MANHSSATARPDTSHVKRLSRTKTVLNDPALDPQSEVVIQHALKTKESSEDDSNREKLEALADIICGGGEESAAALFVLMARMQISTEPDVLAHTVKHFAFTRCGEFNVYGMVDAQVPIVESELLSRQS